MWNQIIFRFGVWLEYCLVSNKGNNLVFAATERNLKDLMFNDLANTRRVDTHSGHSREASKVVRLTGAGNKIVAAMGGEHRRCGLLGMESQLPKMGKF